MLAICQRRELEGSKGVLKGSKGFSSFDMLRRVLKGSKRFCSALKGLEKGSVRVSKGF